MFGRRNEREAARLKERLERLVANFRRITSVNRNVGFFSTGFVATLFAVWWIRSRRTTGYQRMVIPAWLHLDHLKNKMGSVNNYQTIVDEAYTVGYRDQNITSQL